MSLTKSWTVRPSKFPFGVSRETLGVVSGATRDDAQKKAEDLYGRGVVVEPQHGAHGSGSNSPEQSRAADLAHINAQRRLADALRPERLVERPMTADEAQMALAASCCPLLSGSKHKAQIRALHARSHTARRSITEPEATLLRSVVIAFKAKLPEHIVAMAEGATS